MVEKTLVDSGERLRNLLPTFAELRRIARGLVTRSATFCRLVLVRIKASPSANPFIEVDHLLPIWSGIDPADRAALRTFEMRADIVPIPFRQIIQLYRRPVPAAGTRITLGRPDTVDQMVVKPSALAFDGEPLDQ
jgi:hypothetical protein